MRSLFRRTKTTAAAFCERCGEVLWRCVPRDTVRERTLMQFMASGWRSV